MAFTYDNFNSVLDDGDAYTTGQKITVGADAFVYNFSAGDTFTEALRLLNDPYTVVVNGTVGADDGIGINFDAVTGTSKLTVGATGEIFGGLNGVNANHALNVINNGKIAGFGADATGLNLSGSGNSKLTNNAGAEIIGGTGSSDGVTFGGSGIHTVINKGLIETLGIFFAIEGSGLGVEKVTNFGTIDGNVFLDKGDDTFINKGKGFVDGWIHLGEGNDKFIGGSLGDLFIDGSGSDKVKLGGGGDTYAAVENGFESGSDGTDKVDGGKGAGADLYDASNASNNLKINLDSKAHVDGLTNLAKTSATGTAGPGDTGTDTVKNFENASGGNGSDIIFGNKGANELTGNFGTDHLFGLTGNDVLVGGTGTDQLAGGSGRDILWGGDNNGTGDGEADAFIYTALSDSAPGHANRDVIMDFDDGTDIIRTVGLGNLTFVTGQFTGQDQIRVLGTASGWVVQADIGTNGKVNFAIEVHDAAHAITWSAADFDIQI